MPEPTSAQIQKEEGGVVYAFPNGARVYSEKPIDPPPRYVPAPYIDEHGVSRPSRALVFSVPGDANFYRVVPEWRPPALGLIAFGGDLSDMFLDLGPKEYEHVLEIVLRSTGKALKDAGIDDYEKKRGFSIPPEQMERVRRSLDGNHGSPSDMPAS